MPKELFRGIKSKSFLDECGCATIQVFPFVGNTGDDIGYIQESINWNDDDESLREILYRENETGEYDFKAGVGVINSDELLYKLKPYIRMELLTLDHDLDPEKPDNTYHGNIGVKATINSDTKKNIRWQLANLIGYNVLARKEDT